MKLDQLMPAMFEYFLQSVFCESTAVADEHEQNQTAKPTNP
jgi:hypothetical protein